MEVKNYWNRTKLGTALAAMRLTALVSCKLGYSEKAIWEIGKLVSGQSPFQRTGII